MSRLKGQTLQNESAKRQTLQVLQISLGRIGKACAQKLEQ